MNRNERFLEARKRIEETLSERAKKEAKKAEAQKGEIEKRREKLQNNIRLFNEHKDGIVEFLSSVNEEVVNMSGQVLGWQTTTERHFDSTQRLNSVDVYETCYWSHETKQLEARLVTENGAVGIALLLEECLDGCETLCEPWGIVVGTSYGHDQPIVYCQFEPNIDRIPLDQSKEDFFGRLESTVLSHIVAISTQDKSR